MTVNKDFIKRLMDKKDDDTSWRAAKTIEELENKVEELEKAIRNYYYELNNVHGMGYMEYGKHDNNVQVLKQFTAHYNKAYADGVVEYSQHHGFKDFRPVAKEEGATK